MAVKPGTWDRFDLRPILYKELKRRFGSCSTWPPNGSLRSSLNKIPEYKKFVSEMAQAFSLITGEEFSEGAITNQIDWGLSTQEEISHGHMWSWIQNIYWARVNGIIDNSNLPKMIIKEHQDNHADN